MCILLAEDEALIRMTVQDILKDAGHEVAALADGQDAIDLLDQYPKRFTCLVTDHHMPRAHGVQVIEHLRSSSPFTPAILTTALPDAAPPSWRRHHRVHLVVKPYRMDDLVALVSQLLA